jgi:hypothetical protein
MEVLVRRQKVPARWERVNDGYAMIPAAQFGKSLPFWIASAVLLLLSMTGLRRLDVARRRIAPLTGDADVETASVAEHCVSRN